jgi:hypothetical protein
MTQSKSLHTLIAEFFEAESKATKGPWKKDQCGYIWTESPSVPLEFNESCNTYVHRSIASSSRAPDDPNAAFIALSRDTGPEIIHRLSAALACAKEGLVHYANLECNTYEEKLLARETIARIAEIEKNG